MPFRTRTLRRLLTLLLLAGCSPSLRFGEPKPLGATDFVLPPNYQGAVVIWYGRSTGAIAEFKEGRRVYVVPATGLLELREGRQLMHDTLSIRFLASATGDSLHVLGSCRLHRRLIRGATATQVAGCWPPAYERTMREQHDSVSYDAIVVADSAHLGDAYDAVGRLVTARLFGRADASFRWLEPRNRP